MNSIKDYFLIGDLHTAALVSSQGSIDWMCIPHFDSESIFARLLDDSAGTFAVIADGYQVSAQYIKNTAIVETKYIRPDSSFTVYDFMVPQAQDETTTHFLVRKVVGASRENQVRFLFDPMPGYAKRDVRFEKVKSGLKGVIKGQTVWLHTPRTATITRNDKGFTIGVALAEGEEVSLVLEYNQGEESFYGQGDLYTETAKFWQTWIAKGKFFKFNVNELKRSAITLKLMQFYPTGGIIAAPTMGLPSVIGGERNWDYRYVWIRDATFSLYALYVLGYTEEAKRFFNFIDSIVSKREKQDGFDLDLLYTIEGTRVPDEEALSQFRGYQNSKPVRIGNGARDQFQLDTYGSIIDAYYFAWKRGVAISPNARKIVLSAVDKIKTKWKLKDKSIWEFRTSAQHYTYSKVMAWVGVNRALRMSDELAMTEDQKTELVNLEESIHEWVWKYCIDRKENKVKQHSLTDSQDASNFLMVLLQFFNYNDMITTELVEHTADELVINNLFVRRFLVDDGLPGKEGGFMLCSLWYISTLAMVGKFDKAQRLFDDLRKLINPSGLISEQMDPETYEYLGNFPQGFSHVGFIMTAFYLHKYKK